MTSVAQLAVFVILLAVYVDATPVPHRRSNFLRRSTTLRLPQVPSFEKRRPSQPQHVSALYLLPVVRLAVDAKGPQEISGASSSSKSKQPSPSKSTTLSASQSTQSPPAISTSTTFSEMTVVDKPFMSPNHPSKDKTTEGSRSESASETPLHDASQQASKDTTSLLNNTLHPTTTLYSNTESSDTPRPGKPTNDITPAISNNSTDKNISMAAPPPDSSAQVKNAENTSANQTKVDKNHQESNDDADSDDDVIMGPSPISDIFSKSRSKHTQFMQGGIIELIEWLFVFILVAPGTFPAMGCVLYTCTSVARRRINMASAPETQPDPQVLNSNNSNSRSYPTSTSTDMQRRSSGSESGALTARTRYKSSDEREEP